MERDETVAAQVLPGGKHTFVDPRQRGETEPRTHVEIVTRFEQTDFTTEEVTFSIIAKIDRNWMDSATRDNPEAHLWFRLFRIIPQSFEVKKSASDFLKDTDEDEDYTLTWELGRFTQGFEADPASFPLDTVTQYAQYSMIWMRTRNQSFSKGSSPVYLAWTYEVAKRNVGLALNVRATPHPRHAFRHIASFSFVRSATTVTQIGIYLAALFCVTVAVAALSIHNARQSGSHLEDVGGIAALALAIPAIRALLPGPNLNISTLLDAAFLLLFSILISAILIRIALQIPMQKTQTRTNEGPD
ncbi:hypothetical protein FMN63_11415 [Stappia sp. BW2]|uniref:hypothetical protein n=1 Tax=Stappia sp. BW2 TaxID=2592622 RepID=UPI0011DEDE1E|nr:hypothetical protein [Stappia sp. BW2]TYC68284.1 hypothetical protein FMN63_11415 [Stappia sp. BW2]